MPLRRFDRPEQAYAAGYVYIGHVSMTIRPGETTTLAEERLARNFGVTPDACTSNKTAEGEETVLHFYRRQAPDEWKPPAAGGLTDLRRNR